MSDPAQGAPTPPSSTSWPIVLGTLLFGGLIVALIATLATGPKTPPGTTPDGSASNGAVATPVSVQELAAYFKPDAVGFAPVKIDQAKLDQAAKVRTEKLFGPAPTEAQLKPVLDAFVALNRVEAQRGSRIKRDKAAERFQSALTDLYGSSGSRGFQAALDASRPKFFEGLEALARISRAKNTPALDLLGPKVGEDPALQAALDYTAGFALLGVPMGLLNANGQISEARVKPLVEVLYRYRWAAGLRGSVNPRELMTGPELRTLALWRLHEAKGLSLTRRIKHARDLLRYIPNYPVKVAIGIFYMDEGRRVEAGGQFQQVALETPALAPLMQTYMDLVSKGAGRAKHPAAPKGGDALKAPEPPAAPKTPDDTK